MEPTETNEGLETTLKDADAKVVPNALSTLSKIFLNVLEEFTRLFIRVGLLVLMCSTLTELRHTLID